MSQYEFFLRLVAAAILGSLVGLERQRYDKAAGLRTHMLVGVGSALVMIVSAYGFDQVLQPSRIVLDPSRVAAQVVSGIGFLGAGTILRRRETVHGLTTAASVWAVAAVGLAVGGGLYVAATATTMLILVILATIKTLEERFLGRGQRRVVSLLVDWGRFALGDIDAAACRAGVDVLNICIRPGDSPGERNLSVMLGPAPQTKLFALLQALQALEGVREISWEPPIA
jgi:putative Mg2+ transporter-C (MgtC) family protein